MVSLLPQLWIKIPHPWQGKCLEVKKIWYDCVRSSKLWKVEIMVKEDCCFSFWGIYLVMQILLKKTWNILCPNWLLSYPSMCNSSFSVLSFIIQFLIGRFVELLLRTYIIFLWYRTSSCIVCGPLNCGCFWKYKNELVSLLPIIGRECE